MTSPDANTVSTALGSPKRVMEAVHSYGGQVISDVITPAMARTHMKPHPTLRGFHPLSTLALGE